MTLKPVTEWVQVALCRKFQLSLCVPQNRSAGCLLGAGGDLKPEFPQTLSAEKPREMTPLLLPPDFAFIPLEFWQCFRSFWRKLQEKSGQPQLAGGIAVHLGITKWPF